MGGVRTLGKPTHFRPSNSPITACGLVGQGVHIMAYDARDCDCLNCMKTKRYKTYMGKK